jgi:hypothetical protein
MIQTKSYRFRNKFKFRIIVSFGNIGQQHGDYNYNNNRVNSCSCTRDRNSSRYDSAIDNNGANYHDNNSIGPMLRFVQQQSCWQRPLSAARH